MSRATNQEAKQVAKETAEAYSRERYTDAGWAQIAIRLATEGAEVEEIRWILKSKHMRWAADAANRNHSVTAADFNNYVTVHCQGGYERLLRDARKETGKETRQAITGADLAGDCEGEDIADLIDLARTLRNIGGPSAINLRASAILSRIEARRNR